jgi:hypothetical protein
MMAGYNVKVTPEDFDIFFVVLVLFLLQRLHHKAVVLTFK